MQLHRGRVAVGEGMAVDAARVDAGVLEKGLFPERGQVSLVDAHPRIGFVAGIDAAIDERQVHGIVAQVDGQREIGPPLAVDAGLHLHGEAVSRGCQGPPLPQRDADEAAPHAHFPRPVGENGLDGIGPPHFEVERRDAAGNRDAGVVRPDVRQDVGRDSFLTCTGSSQQQDQDSDQFSHRKL